MVSVRNIAFCSSWNNVLWQSGLILVHLSQEVSFVGVTMPQQISNSKTLGWSSHVSITMLTLQCLC